MKSVQLFLIWFFNLFKIKPDPRVEFGKRFYARLQEIVFFENNKTDYKQVVTLFDLKTIDAKRLIFSRTWETPVDEIFKSKAMIRITINVSGQFCFTYVEKMGSRKKVEVILRLNLVKFKQLELLYYTDSQHYPEVGLENAMIQFESLCSSCLLRFSPEEVT